MTAMTERARSILSQLYVAVPFHRLVDEFMDAVMAMGANLELGLHAEALDRFTLAEFKEVEKKLSDKGVETTIHAAFMDLIPGSPDPMIRQASQDRIRQVLDLAPLFRPKSIVCHLGYYPLVHHEVREVWLEHSIAFWSSLAPVARGLDAIITLENTFEWEPDIMKAVLEGVNSPFIRYCFDTGHSMAFSKTDWQGWLTELSPFLAQMHVHDNRGGDDEHLAIGNGNFPFERMFEWLTERSLRPIITLEAHSKNGVFESLQYLEKTWPW